MLLQQQQQQQHQNKLKIIQPAKPSPSLSTSPKVPCTAIKSHNIQCLKQMAQHDDVLCVCVCMCVPSPAARLLPFHFSFSIEDVSEYLLVLPFCHN